MKTPLHRMLLILILGGTPVQAATPASPPPLIQIGVEVVEVDELKTQKLGIRWMDTLHVFETEVPALLKIGTLSRNQVMVDLQALLEEGAADLLANPKLVTRDGTTATFHAGGELPYAAAGGLGTTTVEFKPYGVKLKINPRLDANHRIALSVDAEVSGPDEQNSVTLAGNTVPGIRSRQVSSELVMSPGNTLAMAGLIQNLKQSKTVGVPGLMHIPVLGALFRHKTQSSQRTSIVVFITPTLLESDTLTSSPEGLIEKLDAENLHG
jgi:Flp pilus assembly secretin CpaC